jgi:opacity protein-like surface antigen
MKKFLLLGIFIPAFTFVQAQFHINLLGGFSNYFGDLQSHAYTTQQSHLAVGAGLQYDLTGHFSLLTNLNYGKVGAADSYNPQADLKARNLSFQSTIFEWNVLAEYNLFDLNDHKFTPYIFAGLAVYHFNPYAYDSLGRKVDLKPLSTEGEGLAQYPDRKPYALTQFAIPFGGGVKFRVSDHVVVAYEIGLRKLFTDYLDDVSTGYVDQTILLNAKGPEAVEMAYRGNEVKGSGSSAYPVAGTIRGNPGHKDWYYISGIRVSIDLDTKSLSSHRRSRGVYDCPKKVY